MKKVIEVRRQKKEKKRIVRLKERIERKRKRRAEEIERLETPIIQIYIPLHHAIYFFYSFKKRERLGS